MSALCEQVQDFFAGELSAAAADAFRDHLADCERCQGELHELLQLGALEAELARPATSLHWARKRRVLVAAALPLAIAAAALLWWAGHRGEHDTEDPVVLAQAAHRTIEGRLSYPGASQYRPYDIDRAAQPQPESIPLAKLATLEERGDFHGVAAGYLLLDEPERALKYLDRTGHSADADSDRALALLLHGEPERAVILLGDVLSRKPGHPQALWNRALAYRALGLSLAAASTFDEVAALDEPGWSDEARARAASLRADIEPHIAAYKQFYRQGMAFAAGTAEMSPTELAAFPGLGRLLFYDAVRAAPTRERLAALTAHARALDSAFGGSHLEDFVARAAAADPAVRGPLARRYAEILAGHRPTGARARAYVDALRRAGAHDLLIGALAYLGPGHIRVASEDLSELSRLASATGDPWFRLFAAEQSAQDLIDHHQSDRAVVTLLAASRVCEQHPIVYRCAKIAGLLAWHYLRQHRTSLGARYAKRAWDLARRGGDYWLGLTALTTLAKAAEVRDDISASALPLARAYLEELSLRAPDNCTYQSYGDQIVTMMLVNRGRNEDARAYHERWRHEHAACADAPLTLAEAYVGAHVYAGDGSAGAITRIRGALHRLREAAVPGSGHRALIDHTEGRLLLGREPDTARKLLRRAIEVASAAPATDVEARQARGYSFALLALDAGRHGNYQQALELLAEEAKVAVPARCAVGAALEDDWLVVVRGPDGAIGGAVTPYAHADLDVSNLVTQPFVDRLAGCAVVDVIARPPIHGSAKLLPPQIAWRYLTRRGTQPAAKVGPSQWLLVTDARPPDSLGLGHLAPYRGASAPDQWLHGQTATPSRVLTAMKTATVISIHAHGLVDLETDQASFIALSPDPNGDFALTAAAVRGQRLAGAPLVILGACEAARGAFTFHEPWSLPAAFIDAGASAVIASPAPIGDVDAAAFFDAVRRRIQAGEKPAVVLRDLRAAWRDRPGAGWVNRVLVFD